MAEIVFLYHQKDLFTEFKLYNLKMKEIKYSTQHINKKDIQNVSKTLKNDFITQGPLVSKFELALSKKCNSKYAIALSNASNGLIIACKVLNLKRNDLVWCSAVTFISTISCAIHLTAKFDLIDINLDDYNIDIYSLENKLKIAKKIKKLPKIIIITHLGGNPMNLKKLYYLKKKYKFKIIGEWWFGTDIVDLYRSLLLTDNSKKIFSQNLRKKQIDKFFVKIIDKLQSVLDREQVSSELHFVIKK